MNQNQELDVRVIAPQDKHPKIFEKFDNLALGEGFLLINDHDPMPLKYQFQMERPEQFTWQYNEQGPNVWKVLISKVKEGSEKEEESCCGCGGGSH